MFASALAAHHQAEIQRNHSQLTILAASLSAGTKHRVAQPPQITWRARSEKARHVRIFWWIFCFCSGSAGAFQECVKFVCVISSPLHLMASSTGWPGLADKIRIFVLPQNWNNVDRKHPQTLRVSFFDTPANPWIRRWGWPWCCSIYTRESEKLTILDTESVKRTAFSSERIQESVRESEKTWVSRILGRIPGCRFLNQTASLASAEVRP